MKILNNKQLLQKINGYVSINNSHNQTINKIKFYSYINLIGFDEEHYSFPNTEPSYKHYFSNSSHYVYSENKKLYKKFPTNVLKKYYKEWLRINEKHFK